MKRVLRVFKFLCMFLSVVMLLSDKLPYSMKKSIQWMINQFKSFVSSPQRLEGYSFVSLPDHVLCNQRGNHVHWRIDGQNRSCLHIYRENQWLRSLLCTSSICSSPSSSCPEVEEDAVCLLRQDLLGSLKRILHYFLLPLESLTGIREKDKRKDKSLDILTNK